VQLWDETHVFWHASPISYIAASLGHILMQVFDLFPLWAALHTGCRPLDLEIRGWRSVCSSGVCIRVPSAGIV